jgi:hypothetical protein
MLERIIVWAFFGVALAMTPLFIVAAIGWPPATGTRVFLRLLFQEDMLAVALTLGGASAVNVLASAADSSGPSNSHAVDIHLSCPCYRSRPMLSSRVHAKPLSPDEIYWLAVSVSGATLTGGLFSEVLSEV